LARGGVNALVLERNMPGGQTALTAEIANYPGFESIKGYQLATSFFNHAKSAGAKIVFENVTALYPADAPNKPSKVVTAKNTYYAKYIILALGASPKKLGLQNEGALTGKGVAYCAVCDAPFFKGKIITVVGGGNTAVEDALHGAKFASKVRLIHWTDRLNAQKVLQNALFKNNNIEIIWNSEVVELIERDRALNGIVVKNKKSGDTQTLDTDALFIAIGQNPSTDLVKHTISLNKNGYIKTNKTLQTNIKTIYAAGDSRVTPLRQIVTANADGAIAANEVIQNLLKS